MSTGLLLGLLTLYYIYRSPVSSSATSDPSSSILAVEMRKSDVNTATILASIYWVTQISAYLYPEVTANDQDPSLWYAQGVGCTVLLAVVGCGWWIEMGVVGGREVGEGFWRVVGGMRRKSGDGVEVWYGVLGCIFY